MRNPFRQPQPVPPTANEFEVLGKLQAKYGTVNNPIVRLGAAPKGGILAKVGRAGKVAGRVLGVLGPATIPLDVAYLLNAFGHNTDYARQFMDKDYRRGRYADALLQREEIGADAMEASDNFTNQMTADRYEGLERGRRGIARATARYGVTLEDLVDNDRDLIGGMAQRTPPTLAEIMAAGGVL